MISGDLSQYKIRPRASIIVNDHGVGGSVCQHASQPCAICKETPQE